MTGGTKEAGKPRRRVRDADSAPLILLAPVLGWEALSDGSEWWLRSVSGLLALWGFALLAKVAVGRLRGRARA
ncbi:hypothetical protein ACFU5Y_21940 [Streptomyces gardneri]|uniref:hypothetical protein n=1 Tax=Streptomyces gardneri TaxID=66892 RepID=UPI00368BF213